MEIFKVTVYKLDPTQWFSPESKPNLALWIVLLLCYVYLCISVKKADRELPSHAVKSQSEWSAGIFFCASTASHHNVELIHSSCDYCVTGHVISNLEGVMALWGSEEGEIFLYVHAWSYACLCEARWEVAVYGFCFVHIKHSLYSTLRNCNTQSSLFCDHSMKWTELL